jgi:predicted negative regulator of RcsB-dependent stress response
MSANEADSSVIKHQAPWALLAATGIALMALSIVWPLLSNGRANWSSKKATAYQSAAANLHQLSMKATHTPSEKQSRALHDELAKAQTEYLRLRGELDAARDTPGRGAVLLRYVGLAIACGGAVGLIAKRAAG